MIASRPSESPDQSYLEGSGSISTRLDCLTSSFSISLSQSVGVLLLACFTLSAWVGEMVILRKEVLRSEVSCPREGGVGRFFE